MKTNNLDCDDINFTIHIICCLNYKPYSFDEEEHIELQSIEDKTLMSQFKFGSESKHILPHSYEPGEPYQQNKCIFNFKVGKHTYMSRSMEIEPLVEVFKADPKCKLIVELDMARNERLEVG